MEYRIEFECACIRVVRAGYSGSGVAFNGVQRVRDK